MAGLCWMSSKPAFRPSEVTRRRVWELVEREKREGISPEETSELQHYLQLEHTMRMAKARADPDSLKQH